MRAPPAGTEGTNELGQVSGVENSLEHYVSTCYVVERQLDDT